MEFGGINLRERKKCYFRGINTIEVLTQKFNNMKNIIRISTIIALVSLLFGLPHASAQSEEPVKGFSITAKSTAASHSIWTWVAMIIYMPGAVSACATISVATGVCPQDWTTATPSAPQAAICGVTFCCLSRWNFIRDIFTCGEVL